MSDVKIKFYGVEGSENHNLEVFKNYLGGIYMQISIDGTDHNAWITLNKATAVQLVKKLKLEISKLNKDG
jgi:hypothetical protein